MHLKFPNRRCKALIYTPLAMARGKIDISTAGEESEWTPNISHAGG